MVAQLGSYRPLTRCSCRRSLFYVTAEKNVQFFFFFFLFFFVFFLSSFLTCELFGGYYREGQFFFFFFSSRSLRLRERAVIAVNRGEIIRNLEGFVLVMAVADTRWTFCFARGRRGGKGSERGRAGGDAATPANTVAERPPRRPSPEPGNSESLRPRIKYIHTNHHLEEKQAGKRKKQKHQLSSPPPWLLVCSVAGLLCPPASLSSPQFPGQPAYILRPLNHLPLLLLLASPPHRPSQIPTSASKPSRSHSRQGKVARLSPHLAYWGNDIRD